MDSSTNLHSLSVCDLNTKFNDRCHADWSKSNLISVVTLDGIYILKPQLDVVNGPFQMQLIRNLTSKFKHDEITRIGPRFDTIWQTLDQRQYMEVFSDPALTTNVEKLSTEIYPRRFRLAKWSPIVQCFPRQCLLAVVTVDYQLLVYTSKDGAWTVKADLSSEYDKLWAHSRGDSAKIDSDAENDYETIRKNLHSLSFCNVCWKESKEGGPILLATTIPGDILVWKVIISKDLCDFELEFKIILQNSLEYIGSMHLFESILIVAARDGQVVLYDLINYLNDCEIDQPGKRTTSNGALNPIALVPTTTLWNQDDIETTDFLIHSISEETIRVVLTKSTNICWCIINYKKGTEAEPPALAISDSFSAIDGLDPNVSMHQTSAIWLKPAGNRKAVLIADDGSFFQLEFVDDNQDTSPIFEAIQTGKVDLSRMVPRGLCTSPNGHLITLISCISFIYEPAKILAPTKLLLMPTVNNRKFLNDCIEKLLDESWLSSENIQSPMDVCDRIDYLRSIFPILSHEHYYELFKILSDAASAIDHPKNNTQFVKLKILYLLLMRMTSQSKYKLIEEKQNNDMGSNFHDKILLYNIEDILARIFSAEGADKLQNLSDDQVNSLRNYFYWLDKSADRHAVKERYIDRFNIVEAKYTTIPVESCPICQLEIPFVSHKQGTCEKGHRFDRCARSLLVVNLLTGDEFVCEHCQNHHLASLIWPTSNLWPCSFCQ